MSNEPEIVLELKEKEKQGLLETGYHEGSNEPEEPDSLDQIEGEEDIFLRSNLLSSLLKNIPDSIYFKDREGRFIEVSESKAEHLGVEKESILGKTDFDFYSEKEAQRMGNDDIYVMQNKEILQAEEKVTRPNGETTWVSVVKIPRYDNNGNVVGIIGVSRDITNQKKAEFDLHDSEEKYRSIFENSAVAIMLTDENEKVIQWNSYTEQLLDMGEDDLNNKPVKDLYPKVEWKKMRDENIREKGMQHHLETKMLKKNGEAVDIDISLSVLKNSKGKVTGSIGVIRNISDRKKAELALHDSEEKYRSIFENSAVAIMMTDENEKVIQWNSYTEKLLDMCKDDLNNKSVKDLYPKVEWEKMRDENIREKGMQHHLETKMLKKNGEAVDIDISLSVLKNSKGKVTGSIGVIRDITNRKKMEENLKIKDSAIDSSINAIAITDLKGNISYVNPSFMRLWGYEKNEDVIGEPIVKFWKMKGKYVEVMDAVLNKNGWVGELKAERGNKSIFDIQLSATSVKNNQNEPISMMASFVDITRHKWAEEKLRQNSEEISDKNEELRTSNQELLTIREQISNLNKDLEVKVQQRTTEIENLLKQKDEFIYQLGHDLKTPLTPLNSLLPLVRKKETNEQLVKYLDLMIRNVEYMKNLVEKTLKLALFSSTSFDIDLEDTNVFNIIDAVIKNSEIILEENNINVINLVDTNVVIKADKLRLEELLDNIISNAVKYSPDGGKITIAVEKEEDKIKFSIKDTGQGLTKEQSEKIFDEFYKADESRHDFNSSGLGLSICKRIVEKHSGHIWVESPGLGKGSTFYFTFKIVKSDEKK